MHNHLHVLAVQASGLQRWVELRKGKSLPSVIHIMPIHFIGYSVTDVAMVYARVISCGIRRTKT
jgi:hypothetical protein